MPRVKLEGIGALNKALKSYANKTGTAFKKGCKEAAEMVLANTAELVPKDTGALRASGDHFQDGKGWGTVTVIGYGFSVSGFIDEMGLEKDPSLYAVNQHETLWYKHPVGQASFLQAGVDREIGEISNIITTHVMRV